MDVIDPMTGVRFPLNEVLRRRAMELFDATDYDGVVTYEALTRALGLDPRTDRRARGAVLKAGTEALREQKKKLVCVKMIGYRVVRPDEQVSVSQAEQRAARRRNRRALETVTYILLDSLPPLEVAKVLTEQARVGLLVGMAQTLMRVKTLPAPDQVSLPSAEKLVELFRKKTG